MINVIECVASQAGKFSFKVVKEGVKSFSKAQATAAKLNDAQSLPVEGETCIKSYMVRPG